MWASAQTSLATYVKLFAQHIIRHCAGLENSSGEEETGSFLQGNAVLPRGGSIFTRPGRRWQEPVRWSRGGAARPGQRNPGRTRREAHLGPRTPDPTWLTAASSPTPHLGRRRLAPGPPRPPPPGSPATSLPSHLPPPPTLRHQTSVPRRPLSAASPARASGSPARGAARGAEARAQGGQRWPEPGSRGGARRPGPEGRVLGDRGEGAHRPPARLRPRRLPGSCRTARARPPGCGPACGSAPEPARS